MEGGQAGRKSLIPLFARSGRREGRAPPADVRSAPRIKSPSVHSLGTRLLVNTAPVPSQMARVFLGWRELEGNGWCPWGSLTRGVLVVKI